MKKMVITALAAALLVFACDNGGMDNQEPEKYNVIYFGHRKDDPDNGHTSGEVPIDPKEYKEGDTVNLLPPGTMEKEGYIFIGYEVYNSDPLLYGDIYANLSSDAALLMIPGYPIRISNKNVEVYTSWMEKHQ